MTANPLERTDQVEVHDGDPYDAETVPVEVDDLGPDVDPPDPPAVLFGSVLSARQHDRQPIVPAWLRNQQQRRAFARLVARHGGYTVAYHATRTPKYAAKASLYAPWGLLRAIGRILKWASATEHTYGLMQDAANRNDASTWLHVDRQRERHTRWRWWVVAAAALALIVALGVLLSDLTPWWARWLAVAAAVPVLARLGRPADKPITDRVSNGPRYRKLTAELVRRALKSCGVPAINAALAKDPNAMAFHQEICRDGPGYLAVVDLPLGVEASDVVKQRGRLASGLRLPIDQVWPEAAPGHTGRLAMWVGDEPASRMTQPPWPLLSRSAKVDVFKSFPFATDPRLNVLNGGLMFRNWLIGAMPGAGKTFALRLLLLAAALDHRTELRGYELKGSGDLDALEKVCTEFGSGADDDTVEAALGMLRLLYQECLRRGPVIKRMAKVGKAPENKVTPELAAIKELGLHPLIGFIDECQNLFAHAEFGKEAGEIAEKVIKLGRALGIILILATQRPDAKSLPKGVSDNAGVRFCLRVMGQEANDMVLGTSMYKNGIRATQFGDEELGWGWLVGQGKPIACRGFEVDGPGAKLVIARAIELRTAAGTMPTDAGERERVPAYNLLDDIEAVWPEGEDKVWSELLVKRLAELRPDVYGAWVGEDGDGKPTYNTAALAAALKGYKISTGQVWGQDDHGKGANRRGIVRADLLAAIDSRRQAQIARSRASRDVDALMALED